MSTNASETRQQGGGMIDREMKGLFGRTGLVLPPVVFGTSCLGNLYSAPTDETKLSILREIFRCSPTPVLLDSAGKYGAGLALEVVGAGLRRLGIPAEGVLLSNKLGWRRVPLSGPEVTFEPGVWADLAHDAVQDISHDGILRCYDQGLELLGAPYRPQLVSVHDPDEYLAAAGTHDERRFRMADIVGAYRALADLRAQGVVRWVGIGAKDWQIVREVAREVELDWVMIALSLTVLRHPPEVLTFVEELHRRGIGIINSAVFHAGFLTGGEYFDYHEVRAGDPAHASLFEWRDAFWKLCGEHAVSPAAACVQFALSPPAVATIALNTSAWQKVEGNVALGRAKVPSEFWTAMKRQGLIDPGYPHVP